MVHLIVAGTAPRKGQPVISHEHTVRIWQELTAVHRKTGIDSITTGAANGVDTIALDWARFYGVTAHEFPADWATHQRAAGPIRNRHMLRTTARRYGIDNCVVIGFTRVPLEQSRGTSNCLEVAAKDFNYRTHLFRLDLNRLEF